MAGSRAGGQRLAKGRGGGVVGVDPGEEAGRCGVVRRSGGGGVVVVSGEAAEGRAGVRRGGKGGECFGFSVKGVVGVEEAGGAVVGGGRKTEGGGQRSKDECQPAGVVGVESLEQGAGSGERLEYHF